MFRLISMLPLLSLGLSLLWWHQEASFTKWCTWSEARAWEQLTIFHSLRVQFYYKATLWTHQDSNSWLGTKVHRDPSVRAPWWFAEHAHTIHATTKVIPNTVDATEMWGAHMRKVARTTEWRQRYNFESRSNPENDTRCCSNVHGCSFHDLKLTKRASYSNLIVICADLEPYC